MAKFVFWQFHALLRKEVLEHKNLFIAAPAVVALVIIVINFLVTSQLDDEQLTGFITFLSGSFDEQSPLGMAPIFTFLSAPFMLVLYSITFSYLPNALYRDRKDLSVLFWQSMPVSNFKTVLSKIVTLAAVVPLFYIGIIFGLYLVSILWLTIQGIRFDVEVAGFGYMFLASVVNLFVIYLFAMTSVLWLLPLAGWLLLFSAFANRAPLLWAIGVYFAIGFIEEFVFGTQYLANWVQTRVDPDNFLIADFQAIFYRLFSYDMLIGLVMGSILIGGAIYMRRFID